jgi:molybdenum cofactor cytidylyltransferase
LNPCYAIIPAAGISRRMGSPKLLLPWPASPRCLELLPSESLTSDSPTSRLSMKHATLGTVIDRVLEAWTTSQVTETIVVIRADDQALRDVCRRWPVTIVHPLEKTTDMKGSVIVGLRTVISRCTPVTGTRCFIAPADLPGLTAHVIDGMIDSPFSTQKILIPRFGDTLESSVVGHPALLPLELTQEIFTLGPNEGVDALTKRHSHEFVLFPAELAVRDFDTPDEYQAALKNAR